MKFVLFVEGYTEKKHRAVVEFLKRWLDPRLSQRVGIQPIRFEGWADLVDTIAVKAPLYLHGPKADQVIAVLALLDLYGPTFYPEGLASAKKRLEWAVPHLEAQVGDPRFQVFFAVHEVEAWLLSAPDLFPAMVKRAFPGAVAQPETVNFDEPPSKLLDRLYWERLRRKYKKTVDGIELFGRLDPGIAYTKCPNFQAMMDAMLEMARGAGL